MNIPQGRGGQSSRREAVCSKVVVLLKGQGEEVYPPVEFSLLFGIRP